MFKLPVRSVLVPTDFSDISFQALTAAAGLLGEGGDLHVVHVLPPIVPPSPGVTWGTIDDEVRRRRVLQALEKEVEALSIDRAHLHVRIGTPGTEVAELAEELGADLVMVTSHGRTGLARVALGSVAERVVRLTRRPVLVLKTDPEA